MKLSRDSVTRIARQAGRAELGDPRRSRRLERVVRRVAAAPSSSIPLALEDDAEIQAAYRLVNNPQVTFEAVLAPHIEHTVRLAGERREVLLVHDTTDCSFPALDPEEVGYLQTGKAGFRLHCTLAVDAESWRRPLGIVHAETIFRDKRRRAQWADRPSGSETGRNADREYGRWWRGVKASADRLAACARVVHVADRESDSYELMWQTLDAKQDFVFRVRTDRRGRDARAEGDGWSTVKAVASGCEGLLQREVALSRRKAKSAPGMNKAHPPRKGRTATLRFAATTVVIPRPQYLKDPVPESLQLNLVHVVEVTPPDGEPPVEWLLYTTLAVGTPEQVADVVDKYRTRWLIEEFNAALKSGCAYEAREFESRDALLVMLALSLPIACELLALRSYARASPDAPASDVLSLVQLKVLRALGRRKLPEHPTAQDALLAVAGMGGHLRRNGPPGWLVLNRGMQKLAAYVAGWTAAEAARDL